MKDFILNNITILRLGVVSLIIIFVIIMKSIIKPKKLNTITKIILVSSIIISIGATVILFLSIPKGLYNDMPINKAIAGIKNSPKESKLPDDLSNSIIIYYKFGCPVCETIYNNLNSQIKNKPNIYYVSTKSKQGIDLMKKYPVVKVPTGVYINKNQKDFVQEPLYTKNQDGTFELNQENLNDLLKMQSNNN